MALRIWNAASLYLRGNDLGLRAGSQAASKEKHREGRGFMWRVPLYLGRGQMRERMWRKAHLAKNRGPRPGLICLLIHEPNWPPGVLGVSECMCECVCVFLPWLCLSLAFQLPGAPEGVFLVNCEDVSWTYLAHAAKSCFLFSLPSPTVDSLLGPVVPSGKGQMFS